MSIADKLTYLNETKRQLREAINAVFGAGLTESDSFRSYADFLYGLWTPELLFQGAEQGAWYDPSDLSALFQDAAGTTPVTADGDPVGLMLDKSGNGNHASQAVSANRPVYRTDGVVHWLGFSSVSSWMSSSSSDFMLGVAASHVLAGDLSREEIVYKSAGTGFGDFTYRAGQDNRLAIYRTTPASVSRVFQRTDKTLRVISGEVDGGKLKAWQDGALLSEASTDVGLDFGAKNAGQRLWISSSSAADRSDGRFFGCVFFNDAMGSQGRQICERYLAKKSGVTLP